MRLASESPYPGERANALDAAERLAASHGMSLDQAARAGIKPKAPRGPETEAGPGARRRRPARTYWDQREGAAGEGPDVDWLREFARVRREQRKASESQDTVQALWFALLMCAALSAVGAVAYGFGEVADYFRLVLTDT